MLRSFTKLANDLYFMYPYSNEEINKIRKEFLIVLNRSVNEETYNNFINTKDPETLKNTTAYDAAIVVFGTV